MKINIVFLFVIIIIIVIAIILFFILKKYSVEPLTITRAILPFYRTKFFRVQLYFFIPVIIILLIIYFNPSEKRDFHLKLKRKVVAEIRNDPESIKKFGIIRRFNYPLQRYDIVENKDGNQDIIEITFFIVGEKKNRYVRSRLKFDTLRQEWVVLSYQILRKGQK